MKEVPQPVSPTMRVTRFWRTFSTIFSLRDNTGRDENSGVENGDVYDELQDDVGDDDPIAKTLSVTYSFSLFFCFFFVCFSKKGVKTPVCFAKSVCLALPTL